MKDRIRQIMENLHMNQGAFASHLGTSPATINSIYTGRTRPTLAIVDSIKQRIPNINLEWLMYGVGSMYATNTTAGSAMADGEQTLDFTNSATPSASDGAVNQTALSGQQRGESYLDFSDETSAPTPYQNAPRRQQEVVRADLKFLDKPQRKIKEIRIFFDDGTYESFESKK